VFFLLLKGSMFVPHLVVAFPDLLLFVIVIERSMYVPPSSSLRTRVS